MQTTDSCLSSLNESEPGDSDSLAHYAKQNGGVKSDPEMTFLAGKSGEVFPLTYRNYFVGANQIAAEPNDQGDGVRFNANFNPLFEPLQANGSRTLSNSKTCNSPRLSHSIPRHFTNRRLRIQKKIRAAFDSNDLRRLERKKCEKVKSAVSWIEGSQIVFSP